MAKHWQQLWSYVLGRSPIGLIHMNTISQEPFEDFVFKFGTIIHLVSSMNFEKDFGGLKFTPKFTVTSPNITQELLHL